MRDSWTCIYICLERESGGGEEEREKACDHADGNRRNKMHARQLKTRFRLHYILVCAVFGPQNCVYLCSHLGFFCARFIFIILRLLRFFRHWYDFARRFRRFPCLGGRIVKVLSLPIIILFFL